MFEECYLQKAIKLIKNLLMEERIKFQKIVKENLELACKIQNEIFPNEDARENYNECINKAPYRKELDYYIAYWDDKPIWVTGIYSYHEYPDDAWLGWFGILDDYRWNGLGGELLDRTIKLARDKWYKNFRLYTDEFAKTAHKLYESRWLIKEKYNRPDDEDQYFQAEIYIYSIGLIGNNIELWDNKLLWLKQQ